MQNRAPKSTPKKPYLPLTDEQKRKIKVVRTTDIISVSLVVIVAIVAMLLLPFDIDGYDKRLTPTIAVLYSLLGLQVALMLRIGFQRFGTSQSPREKQTSDNPFRGWLLTAFSPLLVLLVMTPWIASGVFNSDNTGTLASFFMLGLLGYLAWLLGVLFLPFVALPIELILVGLYRLVIKRDASRVGFIFFGLVIAGFTTFAIMMSSAVDIDNSGRAGWPAAIAAVVGLPGGYDVEDIALLWVARAILAAVLLSIIIPTIVSAVRKKQRSNMSHNQPLK